MIEGGGAIQRSTSSTAGAWPGSMSLMAALPEPNRVRKTALSSLPPR